MAPIIKTPQEIEIMRKCGQILGAVLEETSKMVKPGMSTQDLDQFAEDLIIQKGGKPAFKGYQGFPATLCTGVNNVIVHGIPRSDEILEDGDLLTIDCGVLYQGFYTDAARTVQVGNPTPTNTKLLDTALTALRAGIKAAKACVPVSDISKAIEQIITEAGYHVIYDLTGHGIGRNLHEDPIVLNFDDHKPTPLLEAGMTIAIEPIFSVGTNYMDTLDDNWTLVTRDDSLAIQVEETVLITQQGAEVLTKT